MHHTSAASASASPHSGIAHMCAEALTLKLFGGFVELPCHHLDLDLDPRDFAELYRPDFFGHPMNTIVNIGYSIVGAYWLMRIWSQRQQWKSHYHLNRLQYYFALFAMVIFCYAPISIMRTLTFNVYWALLDQWMTVPWFGFVFAWAVALFAYEKLNRPHRQQQRKVSTKAQSWLWSYVSTNPGWWMMMLIASLVTVSALSYPIATSRHPLGFEICIGLHVLGVATAGFLHVYRRPCLRWPFFALCCASIGFIGMKQLDMVLAEMYAPIFRLFSGHFFSKMCDALQLHLVLNFFYCYCLYSSKPQQQKRVRIAEDPVVMEASPAAISASGR